MKEYLQLREKSIDKGDISVVNTVLYPDLPTTLAASEAFDSCNFLLSG
ncbi:MAG: hypothetical protein ACTHK0_14480 [Ginsengibacter sp.]